MAGYDFHVIINEIYRDRVIIIIFPSKLIEFHSNHAKFVSNLH